MVAQLILNLIGIGVGASTLDPRAGANENPSAEGLSIGAAIWWTASGIVASLLGGFAAGRLCGKPKEATAGWHGLSAWAATTLIIFYLLSSAIGGVVGGAYRGLTGVTGGIASAAGGAIQTAAPSLAASADPFSSIEQSIRGVAGTDDPTALREAAIAAVKAAVSGNEQEAAQARTRAADALAKAQNIPVEEARTRVSQIRAAVSGKPSKRPGRRPPMRLRSRPKQSPGRPCLGRSLCFSEALPRGSAAVWELLIRR